MEQWHNCYNISGIKEDNIPNLNYAKIWNVYMTEFIAGSINKPIKFVTEGAKICVPILLVVPPSNNNIDTTFAGMIHFGSYEPFHGMTEDSDTIYKLYIESLNNIMRLLQNMIYTGISLARLRDVKANIYITLGCEHGNTYYIKSLLDIILLEFSNNINIIYHDSYQKCNYSMGHNSIVNAIVFPNGQVELFVAKFVYTTREGRKLYHKYATKNTFHDGTFSPFFWRDTFTNNQIIVPIKLHPIDQEFLIVDMDTDNVNIKRKEFAENLFNRIKLFGREDGLMIFSKQYNQ